MEIVKLTAAYKSIIWGGNKLKSEYGKECELSPLAESWELSLHKDGQSLLPDGRPLSEVASEADLGENCKGFPFFPVLVKFIDARDKLSVQVHPSNEYALKNENSLGKTEMWYIVDADENAGIYLGFKKDVSRDELKIAIEEKNLTEYLRFIPVKKGESYFIPAGTIHAICAGCLICEIQQNSNITYRVYDYGRRDKDGKERELHIKKALDVTNTTATELKELNIPVREGTLKGISKFFTATFVEISGKTKFVKDLGSFRCITCLEGDGYVADVNIKKGDSIFVPAGHDDFYLLGDFKAIMTTVRKYFAKTELLGDKIKCKIENDLGEILVSDAVSYDNEVPDTLNKLIRICGLTPSDIDNYN